MRPNLKPEALAEEFLEHEAVTVCESGDTRTKAEMRQKLRRTSGASVARISKAFTAAVSNGMITKDSSVDEAFNQVKTGMGPLAAFLLSSLLKALAYRFIAWALNRMTDRVT